MTRRLSLGKWKEVDGMLAKTEAALLERGHVFHYRSDGKVRAHAAPSPWRDVKPGDRLWVRENFARNANQLSETVIDTSIVYAADGAGRALDNGTEKPWTPCIHMPRNVSRLTLIVTETKIERLQDMSPADAEAEGCTYLADGPGAGFWIIDGAPMDCCAEGAVECFEKLWVGLHGEKSWQENPEVVALSFRAIKANIDAPEARAA